MSVRVRFAPSPTGNLHIGGVRTALFNWLYARRNQGKFLLRIEDTDTERSKDEHTRDILSCMEWLGMTWDDDLVYQSKRTEVYLKSVEKLLADGHAYRCTCTPDALEKMREKARADGRKPHYDGTCRDVNHGAEQSHVVRIKLPREGAAKFEDLIRGSIEVPNAELDDFILLRTNRTPTYNLTVVVDDADMGITHVIRGDDHLNNTPKQVYLYQFLNRELPLFAHLSMILGPDKKKLSKRHGDVSANVYRKQGYLPEALLNFLVRLGWSHGDQEEFSVQEMIQHFDFDHVQKSAAVYNPEKLNWLNAAHLHRQPPERVRGLLAKDFSTSFDDEAKKYLNSPLGLNLIQDILPKAKLLPDLVEQLVPLCQDSPPEVDASTLKWNKKTDVKATAQNAIGELLREWDERVGGAKSKRDAADRVWGSSASLGEVGVSAAGIEERIKAIAEKHGAKLGMMMQPIRLALTGRMGGVGLFEILSYLPWDYCRARLVKIENF